MARVLWGHVGMGALVIETVLFWFCIVAILALVIISVVHRLGD